MGVTKTATFALAAIAVAFAAAEIVHPTQLTPKRISSRALLLASQDAAIPQPGTLGSELLDDLPRIWPNAPAQLSVGAAGTQTVLRGRIADPYTGLPGAAVFPIRGRQRLARFSASYVGTRYTLEFACAARPGPLSNVAVGLVAADQRGYFHSTATAWVRACAS